MARSLPGRATAASGSYPDSKAATAVTNASVARASPVTNVAP